MGNCFTLLVTIAISTIELKMNQHYKYATVQAIRFLPKSWKSSNGEDLEITTLH